MKSARWSRQVSRAWARCKTQTAAGAGSRATANDRSPIPQAYVVHGLQIAKQNDVALISGMLPRGIHWLKQHQDEEVRKLHNAKTKTKPYKRKADNLDAFVYMVLVDAAVAGDGGAKNNAMRDYLYRDRVDLSVYAKAMFGLALHAQGEKTKARHDPDEHRSIRCRGRREPDRASENAGRDRTATIGMAAKMKPIAYYLKLLARTDPRSKVASRLVKYLLNNRKHATYWNSTRDTALCIEALADYLKASGENRPEMTVEVWIDGEMKKAVEITPQNLFTFDGSFVLSGEAVEEGIHTIETAQNGAPAHSTTTPI